MSNNKPRVAVYFTPRPDTSLWRFGCAVIGYDSNQPNLMRHVRDPRVETVLGVSQVSDPARYGFHATLRAPFELVEGRSIDDVIAAAQTVANHTCPVDLGTLRVARIGRFIALVSDAPPSAAETLAAACIRACEPLRAPLSPADRERRLSAPLTPQELRNLDAWGYPYVFDAFRFHMTLTGKLDDATMTSALPLLERCYREIAAPVMIDHLTVLEQPTRSDQFHIVERISLRGNE